MRVGKALKIVFIAVPLLLVALVVGAIAVLVATDFNKYKPLIAEETKKATGRDLVIAGDLGVEISLTPAVAVSGVTLSNADWGSNPQMVKVERFEAQMSLIPLAFGIIDVQRIVLIGADILLEVDKKGRANFDFQTSTDTGTPATAPATPAAGGGDALAIPVVREVVIRDSRLTYTDARSGAAHKAVIEELIVSGEGLDDPVAAVFQGSYNDAPIAMEATLGAPAQALAPSKPWPVDLTLRAGGATVTATGTIAEPVAARGLDLALAVKGDELGDMSALAGAAVPPLGAYSLSARLTGDPAKVIKLVGLDGALAGSDIAGDVAVTLSGKRPLIEARLKSRMIDVAALGGAAAGDEGEAAGQEQQAVPADRLFPDDPLPLEGLKAVDADLKFDAGTIVVAGAKLQNGEVGLSLKNGKLSVVPIKASVAAGTVDGSVGLDGSKKAAGLAVKLNLSKVDLETLLKDMQITGDVEGKANIDIDVTGRGGSVAGIMASLNGRAGLLMGQGRMKTSFMQNMLGGAGQVLNQVLDKGKAGYTVVNCAVTDFDIRKGIAEAKALYIDTETRGILGSGTANLGTERLDLTIDPRNRKKIDKAVLPVHITGTFLAPDYKVDKRAAATRLTGMLGVDLPKGLTGGGGGSEAPLIEGPCAPPAPAAAAPAESGTSAPAPAPQPAETLKDAGEQLKKGLKGLLNR